MNEQLQAEETGCGGRLVATTGVALPLQSVEVRGEAEGGLARVVLRQVFGNPHAEPLHVIYSMPLPADGAVAGYEFRVGDRRVVGEIDRRTAARERFEQAILEGRTAGLLDQERANLFSQELGNVPPGVEVTVTLTIDQRLGLVSDGAGEAARAAAARATGGINGREASGRWEWRFPTVVPPRYLGAPGRVPDAAAVIQDVADGPTGARVALDFTIRDRLPEGRAPESPSHRLSLGRGEPGPEGPSPHRPPSTRATLAGEGAALDRDLVVRWPVARPKEGASLRLARPEAGRPHAGHAYGLLTIVPPDPAAAAQEVHPRDLIMLLDTSGSMAGAPLAQARKVALALADSLSEADRLELIAFSSEPVRWARGPAAATATARADARRWLEALQAGGGTEMRHAVHEALRPLRQDAPRQVILITDGHIGFEQEIVRELRRSLPAGSRLHAVGVGSAVNRALTRPAARAGRGIEIIVELGEDPERGAARLVAATRRPVVVDLTVEGDALVDCAPRRLPDLMAGAPVLVSARLRPEGGGLVVRGRAPAGPWEARVSVPAAQPGSGDPAVIALYARETVEDLETDLAAGAPAPEIDPAIEKLGLEFAIATRLTSWVAISEEPAVDPRQPTRRVRMPQEIPHGMSVEGLGLRQGVSGREAMVMMAERHVSISYEVSAAPASQKLLRRMFELTGNVDSPATGEMPAREEAEYTMPSTTAPTQPPTSLPAPLPHRQPAHREVFLRGRWVGPVRGGVRILEFEVEGAPLDWHPGSSAVLDIIHGTLREVAVEINESTLVGVIQPGCLVRLALRIDEKTSQETAAVLVTIPGRVIRIAI
jgi:Ca-activated chloride channel family protein